MLPFLLKARLLSFDRLDGGNKLATLVNCLAGISILRVPSLLRYDTFKTLDESAARAVELRIPRPVPINSLGP